MEKVIKCIKENKSFLITTHINPEGDAVGSSIALALILKKLGKRVVVCNTDPVPKNLRFLPYSKKVKQLKAIDGRYDVIVALDCGSISRIGLLKDAKITPSTLILNIDHHVTNERFGHINFIDSKATATGDIIYRLAKTLKVPISRDIAMAIYTTIFTETGSFRYSNTNSDVLRNAADLIDAGLDPWRLSQQVYETNSFNRLKLLGMLLDDMEINSSGKIAWIKVTTGHFTSTNTTVEDVEDFINFPRSIRGVEIAILFRELNPHSYKLSLRSRGRIDVTKVALKFGGGGHKYAAGCVVNGAFDEIKENALKAAEEEIERVMSKRRRTAVA